MTVDISRFAGLTTPFYYYDMELLNATLRTLRDAVGDHPVKVHYAIKANANPHIARTIASYGFGADCVSGREVQFAVDCGFSPADIVFAGVGKTDDEIRSALRLHIGCLNVESIEELEVISQIASEEGIEAPIALRINPDIDAHTHHFITTGLEENKFGIDRRLLDKAIDEIERLGSLRLIGLHFHIGSQITRNDAFVVLCRRVNAILESLRNRGLNLHHIDLGGGLGIDYDDPDLNPIPDFNGLVDTLVSNMRLNPGEEIHIEPGRSVVGQCGTLISKVLYVKKGLSHKFLILDAGMTDLIRPALYQAYHKIENLSNPDGAPTVYDVVGPVCESTDVFAHARTLPEAHRGDIIAIRSAGAYGETMASQYNMRKLPGAVFSDLGEVKTNENTIDSEPVSSPETKA